MTAQNGDLLFKKRLKEKKKQYLYKAKKIKKLEAE